MNTGFSLTFKANTSGLLRDMLEVNNEITQAIGFRANSEMVVFEGIALNPVSTYASETSSNIQLKTSPNPWSDHTFVGFQLSQTAHVRMTFTDETGRLLHSINGTYTAGQHEVRIQRSDIAHTGLVFVHLDTDGFSTVRKMVVTDK